MARKLSKEPSNCSLGQDEQSVVAIFEIAINCNLMDYNTPLLNTLHGARGLEYGLFACDQMQVEVLPYPVFI